MNIQKIKEMNLENSPIGKITERKMTYLNSTMKKPLEGSDYNRVFETIHNVLKSQLISQELHSLEKDRLEWSKRVFKEATAQSSLEKAKGEIEEIEADMKAGKKATGEYVDAIMCLFDSAARNGVSFEDIVEEYGTKNSINFQRRWKKNSDNSYSHIKGGECAYPNCSCQLPCLERPLTFEFDDKRND